LPMPPTLPKELKERMVVWYFEEGWTMEHIAEMAGCSIGLVSKVINNYREYGQVVNPFLQSRGRPSMLSAEDLHFIQELLKANPVLYLDELQDKLYNVR
ncbi:hypothetical protein BDN72DRAFT_721378, partial [Pluteus cervinus]